MSSSSPPPPPNPHSNHFSNSKCSTSSSPSRNFNPRRSKTSSNPESETRWRREPLVDVTNAVLGIRGERRSTRIPSNSSPPTSPIQPQLQNNLTLNYLNHNLPRSSPPRLRRTYTTHSYLNAGLSSDQVGIQGIGEGSRARQDNNGVTGQNRSNSTRSEVEGSRSRNLRSSIITRRNRTITSTSRDVLENSPFISRSLQEEDGGGEGGEENGTSSNGRRLRRRRTDGFFR